MSGLPETSYGTLQRRQESMRHAHLSTTSSPAQDRNLSTLCHAGTLPCWHNGRGGVIDHGYGTLHDFYPLTFVHKSTVVLEDIDTGKIR